MNGPPKDEGPVPPSSRNGDTGPSAINSTPGSLPEAASAVNVQLSGNDKPLTLECGHNSIKECARANVDALLGRDNASPPTNRPPAYFLRTRELPEWRTGERSTIVSMPTHGAGDVSHVDRAIFWGVAQHAERRQRVYAILRKLHRRKLLPLNALIIARVEGGLAIGVDAPDPAQLAAYQTRLNRVQFGFSPWNVRAYGFDEKDYWLADELKLGIVYPDALPAPDGAL